MNKRTLSKIGLWTLITLICIILIPSAYSKLYGHEAQISNAAKWGFPYWIMYLIAIYEFIVLLLFVLGKRVYGSLALIAMMTFAIIVHLVNSEALFTILNFILIGISLAIYFIDKKLKTKSNKILE